MAETPALPAMAWYPTPGSSNFCWCLHKLLFNEHHGDFVSKVTETGVTEIDRLGCGVSRVDIMG